MGISERKQVILVWWGVACLVLYGLSFLFLLQVIPPPSPDMTSEEIADWYADRDTRIGIGAVVTSLTAGWMVPLTVVIVLQMLRVERGVKAWSLLAALGGGLMTVPLVLPPIFWGVAAYEQDRSPEATAIIHQLGHLTMWTTCQWYVLIWVAIAAICLQPKDDPHTPFPRWFGYFTLWSLFMFEFGAIAYLPHDGPFAWDGLFVFWMPTIIYVFWNTFMITMLLRALKRQRADDAPSAQMVGVG